MTLSTATLDEGVAKLAAATAGVGSEVAVALWLWNNRYALIASARQAQDNAKDAERYRELCMHLGANGQYFAFNTYSQDGVNLLRGSIAGHLNAELDRRIAERDAAIAAATPGKGARHDDAGMR